MKYLELAPNRILYVYKLKSDGRLDCELLERHLKNDELHVEVFDTIDFNVDDLLEVISTRNRGYAVDVAREAVAYLDEW